MLKDFIYDDFQNTVSEVLVCNKSVLDILSQIQEANARLNRVVIRTVTGCGCLKIQAGKKEIPSDLSLADLKNFLDSHLLGEMCAECRDAVETALGRLLFYLAALCNLLDLNLCDILLKEQKQLKILGIYNLA
ncbi:MAG: DUF1573 domain-containing protein [Armatimonadetes bacterium]|nr:DUF1573 domain-containing protein [Armatimonadota bacterium]